MGLFDWFKSEEIFRPYIGSYDHLLDLQDEASRIDDSYAMEAFIERLKTKIAFSNMEYIEEGVKELIKDCEARRGELIEYEEFEEEENERLRNVKRKEDKK